MTPGSFTVTTPTYGVPAPRPAVQAKYDAAATTDRNRRHWSNADDLGPVAAHSPMVRSRIRSRARYERQNNGYIGGLIETLALDLVGTGPRLQLNAGDRDAARRVARAFTAWARAADLADKLRVMHESAGTDGETFGAMALNDRIRNPVQLDLRLIECDRVAPPGCGSAPAFGAAADGQIDGIKYDAAGNPVSYHILREHPGDTFTGAVYGVGDWWPAERIVHWFRPSRPGQLRGVSRVAAAICLAPQLRRLTLANLNAAETAASVSGVMTTDLPADAMGSPEGGEGAEGGGAGFSIGDTFSVEPGAFLTLPGGRDIKQFDAKHPTTTYPSFKGEVIAEVGRGVGAPSNIVSANSSGYNYASARLDHQLYHRAVYCERDRLRSRVFDPLFLTWLEFAIRTPEMADVFVGLPPVSEWTWDWFLDGFVSIDPLKDANATAVRLQIGVMTLAEACAENGTDWQETLEQRAAERAEMVALGLPLPDPIGLPLPDETSPDEKKPADGEPAPVGKEAGNGD